MHAMHAAVCGDQDSVFLDTCDRMEVCLKSWTDFENISKEAKRSVNVNQP